MGTHLRTRELRVEIAGQDLRIGCVADLKVAHAFFLDSRCIRDKGH